MDAYKIQLNVFEGPLDLLLYLVKKTEVDVHDIPIVEITDQYLKYLELMKTLDLDIAGEFLWMAANLIYIKSKMLLPPEERPAEEEEENLDPRSELIRQLLEYKRFKEAADELQALEEKRRLFFPKEAVSGDEDQNSSLNLGNVGLFDLLNAFALVLQKLHVRDDLDKIFKEEVSVEEKISYIESTLQTQKSMAFEELFRGAASRMEVVVTFLALLELIRLKKILAKQSLNFGNILIEAIVRV